MRRLHYCDDLHYICQRRHPLHRNWFAFLLRGDNDLSVCTAQHDGHSHCGQTPRKALLVFVYGLATVFSALLVYYGILMVINQYNLGMVTSAMQWPEWIYATFVPFGAVFVTIRFAQATIQEAKVKPESADGKEELSK